MQPIINFPFGLSAYSYNLFFILGIYIGVIVFYFEVKRKKWDIENLMFAMSGCFLGATLGALLFNSILFGSDDTLKKIFEFNVLGMSVLGGILGGFIGVEIFKKIIAHKESTGDAFAIAIPIGHSIGRIGCLLAGCCYGSRTALPWGIQYPENSFPYIIHKHSNLIPDNTIVSLAVHPIPVYEIIFNILLFIVIFKIRDNFKTNGALFRFYVLSYCSFRFFEEFLRADTGAALILNLKLIQINLIISVCLILYWFYKYEINRTRSNS